MSAVSDEIMRRSSSRLMEKGVLSTWERIEVGHLGEFVGMGNKRRAEVPCAVYDDGDEDFIQTQVDAIISEAETQIRIGGNDV